MWLPRIQLGLKQLRSSVHHALPSAASRCYSGSTCEYASDPEKMRSKYDVVIIGGGHNGLVAANYLAKFSKKKLNICLLEKRHVLGGAAVTEELTPGFKFSRASYLMSLFRPIIIQDLDLMRHGMLKFYTRSPSSYTPLAQSDPQYDSKSSRTSLTLGPDAELNRREISKFSAKDAGSYEKYEKWIGDICEVLERFLDVAPPDAKKLQNMNLLQKLSYLKKYVPDLKTAKFYARNYEAIYRLFTEPASHLLDEWFESDVLKATLATDSVIGAMLSPTSPGSAYVLLHHIIGGIEGQKGVWAYVQGGMGTVSSCLAKNAKSFGDQVDIFVSQGVKSIEVAKNGSADYKASGVTLESGKFIECDHLLSNCTPHVTFSKLLGKYEFEKNENAEISNFFKRIKKIDYESGTMKINLAVNRLPNFVADPTRDERTPMPHHRCTIHINCENMQIIDDAYQDAKIRKIPSRKPVIEMVIPSSLDPTLAPKGSHVILLFCQYFNKTSDPAEKEKYVRLVFDSIENYAPGFKDSILFKDVLTAGDLEEVFGLTGGNIFHGALPLNQLFINRPVSEWSQYSTPISNLLLAGAGAHPGGGVVGSAGRLAALECLSKMD